MASTEAPAERLDGTYEGDAADVSIPGPQMALAIVENNTITIETFDIPSPQSGAPSDSTTSLDRRVSSSQLGPLLLPAPSEGWSSIVSIGDFMNNYEDISPRMLRVPLPFPQATEPEWRIFENFFNADRCHFFDNSNNLSCYHFLSLWSLWLQRPELRTAPYHPHSFDNLPPLREDSIVRLPIPIDRTVTADDLKEDICNFQGLNWRKFGTSSASVRIIGFLTGSFRLFVAVGQA